MYAAPRNLVSGRIPEYLENLKSEFESLAHDMNMYKIQRDDYERKLQAQLGELNNIQQTLFDLERNHTKIKQQYEEEIIRLRRQIDQFSGSSVAPITGFGNRPPSPLPTQVSSLGSNTQPPPNLSNTHINNLTGIQQTSLPNTSGPLPSVSNPISTIVQPVLNSTLSRESSRNNNEKEKRPFPSTPVSTKRRETEKDNFNDEKKPETPARNFTETSVGINLPPNLNLDKNKEGPEANGVDWIVGYNPGVQTNLNIDLLHNLEHSSVVCCVKFSNDGKTLATGCNKSAQIYDSETGEKIHTFTDESGKDGDLYIRSVCFSPDNRLLAGAQDKTVKIWNVETRKIHHTFVGHEFDIYSLDFSRDGNFIVSGSGDKKAKIWDVEKGECLFTLGNEEVGPKDGVTSVAFSPDGRLVATGSLDKIVRLWDAQTGYFLERYEGHMDSVYSVAFSPDGKTLASGSLDKTLKLWDLQGSRTRSRCRSTFSGHKDFVLSVAFSPDGNWLISGSKDRSVQFWDPRSAVTHMMLQGHKNSVLSVAVSPSGGQFATGSGDFRARVWKYD